MPISSVILIGPIRTGKSSIAKQLSADTGLSRKSLDDLRWKYYDEIGFDHAHAKLLEDTGRSNERRHYWSKHDPYAIRRFLQEFGRDHVLDFGGSHSLHEDESQLEQVKSILSEYYNVVLVLPAPDIEESLRILNARRGEPHMSYGFDLNRLMLEHKSNYELAKHIIYTKDKSVKESSAELQLLLRVL